MRKDLAVYNEATGFTIHSAQFCGKARKDVIDDLYSNVKDGIIIPISLVQDGSPHIRLITGELTEREEAEWVDKIVWKLRVPCGILVFEGGFDPRGPNDDFLRSVPVSPGNYQVEIYAFFWGINGSESLPADLSEPVGTWYRRTHPGKPFPDNLKFYLGENSEEDPGHEEEWDELYNSEEYDELEEPDLVDFLVRLIPLEQPVDPELKCDSNGWFPIGINPRKPAICPVGIKFNRHG
jgi:hypothetical protein